MTVNRIDQILETMDLPKNRLDLSVAGNVRWLLRNMGIRNSGHEDIKNATKILKDILRGKEND